MILVTWTVNGITDSKEFPDEKLQELMDRANAKFGNPSRILSGPSMTPENKHGSPITPTRPTKKSGGRREKSQSN